jgi:hypothetical protein
MSDETTVEVTPAEAVEVTEEVAAPVAAPVEGAAPAEVVTPEAE